MNSDRGQRVVVADVSISFGNLTWLLVKLAFAAIPALIIVLCILFTVGFALGLVGGILKGI